MCLCTTINKYDRLHYTSIRYYIIYIYIYIYIYIGLIVKLYIVITRQKYINNAIAKALTTNVTY